jgi:lipoyl(octanoyl) transferase
MISVIQLGRLEYAEGLRLQQKLVALRQAGEIGDLLLLLEHTPVITLGRNAKRANVLVSAEQLATQGVGVFECDRGGDVTFHGPGQIVGYPIIDLRGFENASQFSVLGSEKSNSRFEALTSWLPAPTAQETHSQPLVLNSLEPPGRSEASFLARRGTLGAVDYVRRLEEVLIRSCADFGIASKRVSGLTGVWTEKQPEAKIAAIGVHISRSVTSHGFALNVNTDLSYFNLIVPCGIAAKPVASMQKELGHKVDIDAVAHSLSHQFGAVFGRQMLWVETLDALLGNTVGVPMKVPEELRRLRDEEGTRWA